MKKSDNKLIIRHLSKSFKNLGGKNVTVLNNIDLYVNAGELVAVIGPSGCGKTTLLDCISGLTSYDNGSILVNNGKVTQGKHFSSYMMQDDCLLPWRRVINNITLPLEIKGVNKKNANKQARSLLRQFGLAEFEKYYPSQLSGGMRQRVALARTYLADLDLMLMDEPFSRLDELTKTSLEEWFLDIWDKHRKTVIFVTHDIDEAIFLADRIYVMSMRPGRIIAEYKISLSRPRTSKTIISHHFIKLKKNLINDLGVNIRS